MTGIALTFFGIGASVLWGGLLLTLGITLYNERKERIV
ncbi:MAG: MetS family NSS transporter small subunit [Clostridium butyricum]|nr:MetS family NSS transporter small subunit [Clostridium butyricum]